MKLAYKIFRTFIMTVVGIIFVIPIYRATKSVREGLAAQKTPKARAAYRQEHEADLRALFWSC